MASLSITVDRKDDDTTAAETAMTEALEALLPALERLGRAYEADHPGHGVRVAPGRIFVDLSQKRSGRVWSSSSRDVSVDVLRDGQEITARDRWQQEGEPLDLSVREPIADADWSEVKRLCGQRFPLGARIEGRITVSSYGRFRHRDRFTDSTGTWDLMTGERLPSDW